MTEIRVTGMATRALPADQATISATARFVGAERDAVLADALSVHERVVARFRAVIQSGGAERFDADPVNTSSHSWLGEGNERVREHAAWLSASITLTELDGENGAKLVSAIVTDLIAEGADATATWDLSVARRGAAMRELRADAVADARGAAADYAAALGANGIEVIELSETGVATGGVPIHPGMRLAATQDSAPEITAREVEVSQTITLKAQTTP